MIESDNLNRAVDVFVGDVPNPFGTIADDDLLFRTASTAIPGFQIEPFPKCFCRFDRADVGR